MSPEAWLGRIIAHTSASTYWQWNEKFLLKQMLKVRIQGVEGKGGVPLLISCGSPYAVPLLPIHEFCPCRDAGITFFIFIYLQTSVLVHVHHKYSNEEERGSMAKQSDWPLPEWLVFSSRQQYRCSCFLLHPDCSWGLLALYSESKGKRWSDRIPGPVWLRGWVEV